MKIIINVFTILVTVILLSCNSVEDFSVKVTVTNISTFEFDSIKIHLFPDRDTTIYRFKPEDTIIKEFKYKDFVYPRGDNVGAIILAYKDDYYYVGEDGIIDPPYGFLDKEYNFVVWYNGITTKNSIMPKGERTVKHKISEIPR